MITDLRWNRRTFLTHAALASAALVPSRPMQYVGTPITRGANAAPLPALPPPAWLAISAHRSLPGTTSPGLRISRRTTSGALASAPDLHTLGEPEVLAAHPRLPVLYVGIAANSTSGLPATVSAYLIEGLDQRSRTYRLRLMSEQPLSLASTRPRRMLVLPGAQALVTVDQNGQVSVHRLNVNGSPAQLEHVRQLTGSAHVSGSLSRPSDMVCHSASSIVWIADPPCRALVPLAVADGKEPALLPPLTLPPGFDPNRLALNPDQNLLAVSSRSSARLATVALNPQTGQPCAHETVHLHSLAGAQMTGALAFFPDGEHLAIMAGLGHDSSVATHLHTMRLSHSGIENSKSSLINEGGGWSDLQTFGPDLFHVDEHAGLLVHPAMPVNSLSQPPGTHRLTGLTAMVLVPV